jgi:hypothetical protein
VREVRKVREVREVREVTILCCTIDSHLAYTIDIRLDVRTCSATTAAFLATSAFFATFFAAFFAAFAAFAFPACIRRGRGREEGAMGGRGKVGGGGWRERGKEKRKNM